MVSRTRKGEFQWGFLSKLFNKKQSTAGTKGSQCEVEFGADGKVLSVEVQQGKWELEQQDNNKYYIQRANSLLQATELLKKVENIPQLTYYVVETPDGSLGRDMNGFYTEAPLKTKNITLESSDQKSETVEFESLMDYGNTAQNQQSVAFLKMNGRYGKLVLYMKCGHCGYESPVETEAGRMVRECYCCGTENEGSRASILIFMGTNQVEI